ncbi:alpha/beta hydrolase [Amycolatopsis anabasis]|uniref:alpha/beta hydrolase n=1 Tax=Amycolatopsis anabasis TaxID=1840409 RepID=UPI00131E79DA|nr:alpha/beta hydrolase-fold protein [Amycolatopsis anabasis]
MVTRRIFLAGGAGLALTAAGCASGGAPTVPGPPAVPPPPRPVALTEPVTVERVRSQARATEVDLVLITPEGVPAAGLPVCLALHGRGGRARTFLELGVPAMLTAAVRAGAPPFAIAALDGDHYWVAVDQRDDPQRMLTEELPGWLSRRDLRPAPAAAFGISMGAFGAYRYARDHHDLKAVVGCSPALFVNWPDAKARKVFRDEQQWETNEPLRHIEELKPVPVGVWCGVGDPFAHAARRFAQNAAPAAAKFSAGAHNDKYWKRVLPDILKFIGSRLA